MADPQGSVDVHRMSAQNIGDGGNDLSPQSHTAVDLAAWFNTAQKNGISAASLHQVLGFGSYENAWAWMRKFRRAMVRPDRERLCGVVELNETFVAGKSRGKPGASTDKVPVMIAVERLDRGQLGRVRFQVAAMNACPNTSKP
jgi:hypothetical protein